MSAPWEAQHGPGTVVGLAPSAMAAQVLADDLGIVTDNTAQWITQQDRQEQRQHRIGVLAGAIERTDNPRRIDGLRAALTRVQGGSDRWQLHPGQLLIVDEAGMTGTLTLAHLAKPLPAVRGGDRRRVRPALRPLSGPAHAHRGPSVRQRIASGDQDQTTDRAYTAWQTDARSRTSSLLIAADNDTVVQLSQRARNDLVQTGQVDDTTTVVVHNGLSVGRGDVIVTRRIDRTTSDGTTTTEPVVGRRLGAGFVRNGQRWQVQRAHVDGSLTVRLLETGQPGAAVVTLTPHTCESTSTSATPPPPTAPRA